MVGTSCAVSGATAARDDAMDDHYRLGVGGIRLWRTTVDMPRELIEHDDPRQRRPDIGQAIDRLGWRPEVDLRAGLSHTIEFFAGVIG